MKIQAERYHDISCGHRVVGHEGKCRFLHGHNYRFHFTVEADSLDSVGRVIDFDFIKSTICEWLETNWDHKFLVWDKDFELPVGSCGLLRESVVFVPFNPTAENMARHMFRISKDCFPANVALVKVRVEETAKCSAVVEVK